MQRFLSRREILTGLGSVIALPKFGFGGGQSTDGQPQAQELRDWLKDKRERLKPGSNSYQLATTLVSAFTHPTDGRQRYVLPRADSLARRNLPAWGEVLPTAQDRSHFYELLRNYLNELSTSLESREYVGAADSPHSPTSTSAEVALRLAGLATLLPLNESADWQSRSSHPSIAAIKTLRRAVSTPKGPHAVTGWPASSYQLVQTPHFDIAIQGRNRANPDIAEICEQTFAIWTQLFSSIWQNSVSAESSGERSSAKPPRWVPTLGSPFRVVAFSNKENYLRAIEANVPNASASVGYYNPQLRTAFLFVEQNRNFATLVHELTHQFFHESLGETHFDLNESAGYWLAEGVALYMESLSISDLGSARLIDVGGWDSPRLQASRFRILYEGMWFPWDEFSAADGVRFRDPRELAQRYSQASGVTHYLFEGGPKFTLGDMPSVQKQIAALYIQGEEVPAQGDMDEALMRGYMEFMRHPEIDSQNYQPFASRSELILPRCEFTSKELAAVLTSRNTWDAIDVAFTKCDDEVFEHLPADFRVTRLSIESTSITDASLAKIATWDRLQELDLSHCQISSEGISYFKNHPTLKILWIVDTQVDDRAVETLSSIKGLHTLHAKECKISPEGWSKLLGAAPRLAKKSTAP